MSETPTIPFIDSKTDQVAANADALLSDSIQSAEFWRNAELQVAPQPDTGGLFDLFNDELPNGKIWNDGELEAPVEAIQRIEEAKPALTRAQEVEMMFHPLNDQQLLQRFSEITNAMGRLHQIV